MSESVGFVGIGIMGQGMVRNLARAGLKPLIWNRTRSRLDDLVAEGFEVAESPAAVAAASDVIITCVSDTPDVETVVLGGESHARIDAIGGPSTRKDNGVVCQRDGMEHRGFHVARPAFG